MKSFALFLSLLVCTSHAFAPAPSSSSVAHQMTFALKMANNDKDDLLKFARASRQASSEDRVVELARPLGVILADDGKGNVYVETLAPKGNAARSGMVSD
jgi:hypothetical protein